MGKYLIHGFLRSALSVGWTLKNIQEGKRGKFWGHTMMPTTKSVFSDLFLLHYKKMKIKDLQLLMVRVNPE